jgi:hypothetical protein
MDSIGLWLVKTQTVGTAVASVTVTGAFSADYDNYRIVWSNIVASTGSNFTMQLSGITGNVYTTAGTFLSYGSTTVTGFGPAATSNWVIGPAGTTNTLGSLDVFNPQASLTKGFVGMATSNVSQYSFNGFCTSTSAATGFVFAPTSGTITGGTIKVYGYRN